MTERIGPYRVYERLGVGGMGEVFKAYDDRLDRWVAIKRIRPDRLDAEDNRERFKREARATARLNHPSIVHLYGIFQDEEDADCIVMEFVDGRTLDTFLSEGPLEPLRVASLGHEIAAGLAEAHANGILHRDLKAENIMITPRGRAKILDFGLAKPILSSELDPVLTSKGQLVGTSRAMSPEYVSGEEVDHRSDLFSMGVLLYECLTGQSPFKAHNTLATLKQVMLHHQVPVTTINPGVPQELSDLIDRLLAKDPAARPQNAEEVALAFGRLTGQISSGIIDSPSLGSGGHNRNTTTTTITASDTMLDLRPRRRWMPVTGILLVALMGAFLLGQLFDFGPSEPDLPPDQRIEIVLGEFANSTGEEMLGESLAEAFRAVLDQSRSNRVLPQSQVNGTLERMQKPNVKITREIGVEVSEREGAERLILGNISKLGKSYSIVIDVVKPDGDENDFSVNGSAQTQDELLSMVESLAKDVRRNLGDSAMVFTENAMPLERVTTSSLEALKAYTIGERHLIQGRSEQALEFFQRAVSQDEDFAMANAKIGVAYINSGEVAMAADYFKKALEREEGLSEVQKLYLKGWLARWRGEPEQVLAIFGLMAELYPSNQTANYNLGLARRIYQNDFVGASESLKAALEFSAGEERSTIYTQLGFSYLGSDRYTEAFEVFEASQDPGRLRGMIALALLQGRPEKASEYVDLVEFPGDALMQSALVQVFSGRFESAKQDLKRAEQVFLSDSDYGNFYRCIADQAAVSFLLNDKKGVIEAAKYLEEVYRSIADDEASDSIYPTTLFLAKLLTRVGERELAVSIVDSTIDIASPSRYQVLEAFRLSFQAEVALVEGDLVTSLAKAELSSSMASSVQLLETLAMAKWASGQPDEATSLFRSIELRPGLALIECFSSCAGRLYSSLLPRVGFYRFADSLEGEGHEELKFEAADSLKASWPEGASVILGGGGV